MLRYIEYFIITIFATTAGAMTGMGGGVIMKPVLDLLGHYNVETIGILSAITVFSMAVVSITKQFRQGMKVNLSFGSFLVLGSLTGGTIGQFMLSGAITAWGSKVTAIQNVILALMILGVYLYMKNKDHIKSLDAKSPLPFFLVGTVLGLLSSFLSIGGGPINVALLIFVFSFDTKMSTVYSLLIVLFAQISKLVNVAFTTGFGGFNLSMLPVMIIAAIAGGFIGAGLNKKLPEKTVEKCFNMVQILVLVIAVSNLLKVLI